jgi:hypothetical protein
MREIDNFDIAALLPLAYLLGLLYIIAALILWPFGLPLFRHGQLSGVMSAGAAITFCLATLYIVRQAPAGAITPGIVKAALFSASVIILSFSSYIASVPYFAIKPAIPLINGHDYDQALALFQQRLFDGVSPSAWIISKISGREVDFLDFSYNLLIPFLSLSLMIAVYTKGLRGGVQLNIAQFVGLFICLLIALAFPTKGPLFQHPALYFPKLTNTASGHLAQYLVATGAQYLRDPTDAPLLAGIAAMPSYHVYSWGCALIYWRYLPRWALAIGIAVCALDWLSTIGLGWHYALDGVVALLLVFPVWKFTDSFVRLATPAKRPLARPIAEPGALPFPASVDGS